MRWWLIIALLLGGATAAAQGPVAGRVGGSGTINTIPLWATPTVLGDSIIVENSGKIGIGAPTPAAPLHILADSGGDAIRIEENVGGEVWEMGVDATGDLTFKDAGVVRVVFEDGGNVGIGVEDPITRLHVLSNVAGDAIRVEENSGGEFWKAGVDADGNLNWTESGIIRVSFGSGGNVGIGTTAPSALLDLDEGTGRGIIEIDGSTGGCLKIRDTDDAAWTYCTVIGGVMSCSTSAC